jgi:predicted N-acyltransferase
MPRVTLASPQPKALAPLSSLSADSYTCRLHSQISELGADVWQAIAPPNFPFCDYRFLDALESSGSVAADTGWQPLHLSLWDSNERLVAAMPLYLKTDSYGEYIFDWSWANAYARHCIPYYPKLVSAIPFTPATGPKLLGSAPQALIKAAQALARKLDCSSLHLLFLDESETTSAAAYDLPIRASYQFHWHNRGFADFAEFLASLRQKKRKEIRRERRLVSELPLRIETLTGDALTPEHAQIMYGFYLDTISRKWATPYLTAAFFQTIFSSFREHIVLHLAFEESGEAIAGSIAFRKGNALFGRYWGCSRIYPHLHFELCYYRGIDFAIANGLERFEAGAQGSHKVQRGFSPTVTRSAHWIAHPQFATAIADFIADEEAAIVNEFEDSPDAYKTKAAAPSIAASPGGNSETRI